MDLSDHPPTPKGRRYETRAIGLRQFAGLTNDEQALNPFELARAARLFVATFDQVEPLLSESARKQLLGDGKDKWSGGAASQTLPSGERLIILNPTHGKARMKATLMEEISHLFLGHKPSRLQIERRDKSGKIIARDFHADIEEEAYSTGAAALVPFTGLRRMVRKGMTSREIARHFDVSVALVEYRIKISRLWDLYKECVFSGQ